MFFCHRQDRPSDDCSNCLQYLFDNDIIGPAMPQRYFDDRIVDPVLCPDFPIGVGSSVCLNYSDAAIQRTLTGFSTVVRDLGDVRLEVQHDDVGLSQESYQAPEYEFEAEMEGVYDFDQRSPPPDDPDIPQEDEGPSDEDDGEDSSVDNSTMVPHVAEHDADFVMQSDEEEVQEILEQSEVLHFHGFLKLVNEKMREQLDLLEQYSRSGNCNVNRYNLRQVCEECVGPLLRFRLKVAQDIAEHTNQNHGQEDVSTNCVNPSKRRRVYGAAWGISQFSQSGGDL